MQDVMTIQQIEEQHVDEKAFPFVTNKSASILFIRGHDSVYKA